MRGGWGVLQRVKVLTAGSIDIQLLEPAIRKVIGDEMEPKNKSKKENFTGWGSANDQQQDDDAASLGGTASDGSFAVLSTATHATEDQQQ